MIHSFFFFFSTEYTKSVAEQKPEQASNTKTNTIQCKKKPPKKISQLFTSLHIGIEEYVWWICESISNHGRFHQQKNIKDELKRNML